MAAQSDVDRSIITPVSACFDFKKFKILCAAALRSESLMVVMFEPEPPPLTGGVVLFGSASSCTSRVIGLLHLLKSAEVIYAVYIPITVKV
jgi:hypothetical protein